MGSSAAKCISKPPATSTPGPDMNHAVKRHLSASLDQQSPWIGEWTYIIKNQVHSFDITNQNGKLYYTENMGSNKIKGKVMIKDNNQSARIVAKSMNFEIDLNRKKMVARYRTIGSSKWTKEIGLMKVDEIDDVGTEGSLSWNKSTLRNTWKNASLRDTLPREPSIRRDSTMRGCSVRKMDSMRNYTVGRSQSTNSQDVEELFQQNSTRRSIRFAEECKQQFLDDLMYSSESDKEN